MAMYQLIQFDQEEKYRKDFLRLPKLLYHKNELVQNEKEEQALLFNQHILSKYFKVYKLLVYKENEVCARCLITLYDGEDVAYIGYFECIHDVECARELFDAVKKIIRSENRRKLIGPVNCSFWISYRLKIDHFDHKPYMSEPYNKDYYLDLFLKAGFDIGERYISNCYDKIPLLLYKNVKSKNRYREFVKKGYKFISPKKQEYDKAIKEIYHLLITLYKNFPVYHEISEADFVKHFEGFRYILDYKFVKLVYYENEPVGFTIGVPDYGNKLYGPISIGKLVALALHKIRSRNYIILYMGVKAEHYGLGNAMAQIMIKNLWKKRATSVGALIKEGKSTQGYAKERMIRSNTYVLLEQDL